MAQEVIDLPMQRPGSIAGSPMGFVVDKVALWQVFLRVLWSSLSVSVHPCYTLIPSSSSNAA